MSKIVAPSDHFGALAQNALFLQELSYELINLSNGWLMAVLQLQAGDYTAGQTGW